MTAIMPNSLAALPASIPSPVENTWNLGPIPIRAYALAIIVGIVVAIWLGNRRWVARGGAPGAVVDIAIWAVPFGIVGARAYHVITDNQLYFGAASNRDWWEIFYIWEGGIGIWGAVAGGALGTWIACRQRNIPFLAMADALAPGVLIAQGIGRWGNYFNNELYGRRTDLPWGLEVHRMEGGSAVIGPDGEPERLEGLYHPTFLYESLWAFAVALVLIWADRRFRLGYGRVFALYVAGYTLGRGFFEYLRIDPANEIFGLRVNLWVSGLLFVAAIAFFIRSARKHPGREAPETLLGTYASGDAAAAGQGSDASDTADSENHSSTGGTADSDPDSSSDAGTDAEKDPAETSEDADSR